MTPEQAETALHIAANTWAELRKCDVYRLIEVYGSEYAIHITTNRPDLADECTECIADLSDDT